MNMNSILTIFRYNDNSQRTVKLFIPTLPMSTVPSDTLRYTLYVGPHYTVTSKSGSEDEDPLFVKHFFGNKRDVSELSGSRVLL